MSKPRRRRAVAWLALVLLASLALEAVLQVMAFGAYLWTEDVRGPGSQDAPDGAPVVLCMGDSFTFGFGATGPVQSYPAALGRALAARGVPAEVHNEGWSGRNSRDVLADLPGQLERWRPDVVVVLVGFNDYWTRPELLEDESATGFPWRWRTRRLAALVWRGLPGTSTLAARDDAPDAVDPSTFLGTWHAGDHVFTLHPDGRFDADGTHLRWRFEGGRLLALGRDGAWRPLDVAREGRVLTLGGAALPAPVRLLPGEPDGVDRAVRKIRQALDDDRLEGAERWLEDLTAPPGEARVLAASGRAEEAQGVVARLVELRDESGDLEIGRMVVDLHELLGEVRGAVLAACWCVEHGADEGILSVAKRMAVDGLAARGVRRALTLGLAAMPPGDVRRAVVMRALARFERREEPEQALVRLGRAQRLDGDAGATLSLVQRGRAHDPPGALERAVEQLDREGFLAFGRLLAEADEQGLWTRVLSGHLTRMASLSRAAGARFVLLTYPEAVAGVDEVVSEVAADQGVPLVALHAAFEAHASEHPDVSLFIPDGHCNDAGYALLAETLADALAPLLQDRRPGAPSR